jgi:hypothetical protein
MSIVGQEFLNGELLLIDNVDRVKHRSTWIMPSDHIDV